MIKIDDALTHLQEVEENSIVSKWSEPYKDRYQRNIGALTLKEQDDLKNSVVGIIGVGGTGGTSVEILARTGINELRIVDIDHYERSNINRQIFATEETSGMHKVDGCAQRLLQINPELSVKKYYGVDEDNIDDFLDNCDVLVLAADDHVIRIFGSREARKRGIPIVDGWGPFDYANVHVLLPDGPSYEESHGMYTQHMSMDEIRKDESLDSQASLWFFGVEGLLARLPDNTLLLNIMGSFRRPVSFAPTVFMTSSMMALEVVKLIIKPNEKDMMLASGKNFKWYDPWLHRIPKQYDPVHDKHLPE